MRNLASLMILPKCSVFEMICVLESDTGTAFTKDQKIQQRVKGEADEDSLHG